MTTTGVFDEIRIHDKQITSRMRILFLLYLYDQYSIK